MTDGKRTARFEVDQDELLKQVLDGDTINMTTAHENSDERISVLIDINESDALFRDQEILSRIQRIATTQEQQLEGE